MRRLERSLLVVAVLSIGFWVWTRIDSHLYQARQEARLEGILAQARDRPGSPSSATDESGLIGRIEIPRLGISAIVAEGTEKRTLRRAVGHVAGTALPGEPGNVVLAAHRDSFFSGLADVRVGDRMRMTTPGGQFEYRVDSRIVVESDQIEVLSPSDTPTLTLITCFPFRYIGPAPQRLVVRAALETVSVPDV